MAQGTAEPESLKEDLEIERVYAWRFNELVRAGYPLRTAKILAEHPRVDLHEARELVRRGATVRQAVRILL